MFETSIGLAIFEPELENNIDRLINESDEQRNWLITNSMNWLNKGRNWTTDQFQWTIEPYSNEKGNWNEYFWKNGFRNGFKMVFPSMDRNQAEVVKCLIHG